MNIIVLSCLWRSYYPLDTLVYQVAWLDIYSDARGDGSDS